MSSRRYLRDIVVLASTRLLFRTAVACVLVTLSIHALYMLLATTGALQWTGSDYFDWLHRVASGHPFWMPGRLERAVAADAMARSAMSLALTSVAFVGAIWMAVSAGEWRAYRESWLGKGCSFGIRDIPPALSSAVVHVVTAIPAYVLAYACVIIWGTRGAVLQALVVLTLSSGFGLEIEHLVSRIQKANLRTGYVETALAAGLPTRSAPWDDASVAAHAFRNTLATVLPIAASRLPVLLGSEIAVEVVFDLPGIGDTFLTAVRHSDVRMVLSLVMLFVIFVRLTTFLADILSYMLRPRELRVRIVE